MHGRDLRAGRGPRARPRASSTATSCASSRPGTILEEESLDPRSASLLAVVARGDDGFALAACDLSTGEVRVMEFPMAARTPPTGDGPRARRRRVVDAVAEELARLGAKELVVAPELQATLPRLTAQAPDVFRSLAPAEWFDARARPRAGSAHGDGGAGRVGAAGARRARRAARLPRATYRGKLDHLRAAGARTARATRSCSTDDAHAT